MRIAVLDDDPILQELLKSTLERHDHACRTYGTGTSFLKDLRTETFDLLILDWHLPDMDGPQVAQTARQMVGPELPMLFITRRNGERDVIEGLAHGGDDFMTKPLRMGELVARVSALLRRAFPQAMCSRLEFGPYSFDPTQRSLSLNGHQIILNSREYELALLLFRNTGRLLSRGHIRDSVWGDLSDGQSRSLDTHVSHLRTKLSLLPASGYAITSIYGVGYRLDKARSNAVVTQAPSTAPPPPTNATTENPLAEIEATPARPSGQPPSSRMGSSARNDGLGSTLH